jgi:ERCC4-type nuclease
MQIITDTREQAPYSFSRWPGAIITRAILHSGYYSLQGFQDRVSIERKSLDDLVDCLLGDNRVLFERILVRLRSYRLSAVVIEANLQDLARGRYQSQMKPKSAILRRQLRQ